jgi:rhodanese-related sulfurtransferase
MNEMKDFYDPAELRRLQARGAAILNVLPPAEYKTAHIKGSESLPLEHLDAESVAKLDRKGPVVVYCNDFQ